MDDLAAQLASSEVTPTARASPPLFAEAALAALMEASRADAGAAAAGGCAPALADARALRACLGRVRWCADALEAWGADASALAPAQRAALAARRDALAEQLHRRLFSRCDSWPACAPHAAALRARWAPYAPDPTAWPHTVARRGRRARRRARARALSPSTF